MASRDSGEEKKSGIFPKTLWGVVTYPALARAAERACVRDTFCNLYREPILTVIRSKGYHPVDAEDLTHDFLIHFLESDGLGRARQNKGRLREYLGAALNHFLANVRARERTQRRGGEMVMMGTEVLEQMPAREESSTLDREWLRSLIAQAVEQLRKRYQGRRRARLFRALQPFLLDEREAPPYRKLSARLLATPVALRSELKRLRARLREELRRRLRVETGPDGDKPRDR